MCGDHTYTHYHSDGDDWVGWVTAAEAEGDVMRADDVDRQLCDGQAPAVDITTGRLYDCDDCPPSTYCHRLSTSSACCWIGD